MFSIVMTWIGAMLGVVVLLAMAFGAFVLDVDDALYRRDRKPRETRDGSGAKPSLLG
ncbi:hypothetical protein SAMN05421810_107234 [Amycolatopsis arida]|uniref:Uncharacterized protein n=1 Tax=Amycolatopsis arida TaxID=587909 RepID=A0A1I5YKQ2_9PSEU|nr:hypothetical protein [Amycolatopsis arida]TDX90587.1 hypothetical protein CLV69_107234 [Amycolatopsis arida]SFQ44813.1 hypothetical protein SAMN05421810_107234 [Amycolatopsis arida]